MLDYMTCPSKNEDAFVKLCRNASLRVEDVESKIAEIDKPSPQEARDNTPSKTDAADDETRSAVGVPTLHRGPAAPKRSATKSTVEDAATVRSPQGSPREGSDVVKSFLGDDDRLNFDAILSGATKAGHSRRRMREKENQLRKVGTATDVQKADLINERLTVANAAAECSDPKHIQFGEWKKVAEELQLLRQNGVVWPAHLQDACLHRRLTNLVPNWPVGQEDCESKLDMVVQWIAMVAPHAGDAPPVLDFDPLEPTVRCFDLTRAEKIA
eukprot:2303837-Pyramimonas_sp.AAC.1